MLEPRTEFVWANLRISMQSKLFFLLGLLTVHSAYADKMAATNTPTTIPWDQIGARAGADYQGDGLAVTPSGSGARLHCLFQRLEGEATPQGLWLTSTVTNTASDRFRVTAIEVGRQDAGERRGEGERGRW